MTKHTPRPWGFGNTGEGKRLILGANGTGPYVCSVQIHQTPRRMGMMDEEEREANALLIKAAPDTYKALKDLKDIVKDILLPKCRGESEDLWLVQQVQIESAFAETNKALAKAEGK